MNDIPKDKISCLICINRGESPISGGCEGCNSFSKFSVNYKIICKWCYNPALLPDNVCASCKVNMKSMSVKFPEPKTFTAEEIRKICDRLTAINSEFGTNEKAIKSHKNAYELLCLILEGRSE